MHMVPCVSLPHPINKPFFHFSKLEYKQEIADSERRKVNLYFYPDYLGYVVGKDSRFQDSHTEPRQNWDLLRV